MPAITSAYANHFGLICDLGVDLFFCESGKQISSSRECVIPFSIQDDFFKNKELTFFVFNELESLGLIKCHFSRDYVVKSKGDEIIAEYFGNKLCFKIDKGEAFPIGSIMLTETGKIIRDVTERRFIEGYTQTLEKYYKIDKKMSFA